MIMELEEKVKFKGAVRTRRLFAESYSTIARMYNSSFKGVLLSLKVINRYPDVMGKVAEVNGEKGFVTWNFQNNGGILVKFTHSRYEYINIKNIKEIPDRKEGEEVTIKADISGIPHEACSIVEEMKIRQGQTFRIVRVLDNRGGESLVRSGYKLEGSSYTWSEMCFE